VTPYGESLFRALLRLLERPDVEGNRLDPGIFTVTFYSLIQGLSPDIFNPPTND
jgi:hypothetical protein